MKDKEEGISKKNKCRRCEKVKPIEIFGYCKECVDILKGNK